MIIIRFKGLNTKVFLGRHWGRTSDYKILAETMSKHSLITDCMYRIPGLSLVQKD